MRVGVLSDTHGAIEKAMRAIQKKMGEIDALIHAGDLYSDALQLRSLLSIPVYAVSGNCDIFSQGQEELVFSLEGCKFYITHGHLYRVKNDLQLLRERAKEIGAQVTVFGHTHIPCNRKEGGILLFNPGSASRPLPGQQACCGILKVEKGKACGKLLYI